MRAGILLLLESKELYVVYKKNLKLKNQYDLIQLNSTMHLNMNMNMNTSMSNGTTNYA